jgi:hypothetical protein
VGEKGEIRLKLTKALLSEHGIHNPHNFCTAGGGKIYIAYSPQITGRAYRSASWQVIMPNGKTDPDGAWCDNGQKSFDVNSVAVPECDTPHKRKEYQRLAAIAWATEKYGIDDWVKDPFGDYQQREVWERVVEKIKTKQLSRTEPLHP